MEARELAEMLKEHVNVSQWAEVVLGATGTAWGYGDADFFVETDDGKFLVSVVKVSE